MQAGFSVVESPKCFKGLLEGVLYKKLRLLLLQEICMSHTIDVHKPISSQSHLPFKDKA
jgi:hypothetical protein